MKIQMESLAWKVISNIIVNAIAYELGEHEEVAHVELDEDSFDLVLYTDYALSYNDAQCD